MKRLALILLACTIALPSAHAGDAGVKQTITFVQKLQADSGGFRSHDPKEDAIKIAPTLRATSSALRALRYFGGDVPKKEACVKFVDSCYDPKTGGFANTPDGKPGVFETAVGLMAAVELRMPTDKYAGGASKYLSENAKSFEEIRIAAAGFEAIKKTPPKADQWQRDVLKPLGNGDGTYGKGLSKARDTASGVVTGMRLGGSGGALCLKILDDGQRQNGGWGKADSEIASDLETTYRVMRCYAMLKSMPGNVEGVRSFVAKCRNADGGYGVAPGQPSDVSGTYFASIILHWLKE